MKRETAFRIWAIAFLLTVFCIACDHGPGGTVDGPDGEDPVYPDSRHLTTDITDIKPRWSPSGNKIVFERRGGIYYVEMISGGIFYMTMGYSPCWSPDGTNIAFIRDSELYIIRDIPERPVQKITTGANISYICGIDWGGDNEVVYFQQSDTSNPNRRMYTYSMSSGGYHYIPVSDLGFAESPRWSSDKSKILFNSNTKGICVLNTEDEILFQVVEYGVVGKCSWMNTVDSTFILFNERGVLYRINPDGTGRRPLFGNTFYPGSISYHMSKKQLTFNDEGIWTMKMPPSDPYADP